MTAPPPRFSIAGTAARVARNIDLRSTAITRSHSSSCVSTRSLRDSMPTLLWRMSSPPQRALASATIPSQSAARVTSAAKAVASPPSPRMIPTVSSARSLSWSTHRTRAPSRAKGVARAWPSPRRGPRAQPPVTSAFLPVVGPLRPWLRPPRGRIPSGGARGCQEPAVKRVLILTASYGSGHNAAARCLVRAFERERCAVTVVDHFGELVSPLFERASRALYYAMLRRAPLLWSIGYALGDWMASDSPLALGVTRLGARRLAALLESLWPDAVVTTHATPATAMSSLAAHGRRTPPHTAVVTDFVAHSQWIARHIHCYCVAADEVKHEFIARGIPAQRIVVTGMPVRDEFAEPVDPAAARAALGLSDRAPVVLAMAGSRGSLGRLPDVARALDAVERPLQGLLVCGHDRHLKRKLERLTDGTRVRTLGYTDDVRRLMVAADLLVTKAGGLTLAEAMVAELPVLAYGSLPGQERRNERFAARAGIGLVARSYLELVHLLDRALGDSDLLDRLRARIRGVRRPGATQPSVAATLSPLARPARRP